MNTTRRGKIAKLPRDIREQLNRRMEEGEGGEALLAWLNGLPETKAVLAEKFDQAPINEVNLSNWRLGGHRDWVAHQEAQTRVDRVIESAGEIEGDKAGLLGDRLSVWVVSRLLLAADTLGAEGAEEKDWKLLRELSHDVAELRKGDRGAAWVRLDQERLADERAERQKAKEEEFLKWAEDPNVREAICRKYTTRGEKLGALRKAMFADIDEMVKRGSMAGEGRVPTQGSPKAD